MNTYYTPLQLHHIIKKHITFIIARYKHLRMMYIRFITAKYASQSKKHACYLSLPHILEHIVLFILIKYIHYTYSGTCHVKCR